MMRHAQLKSHAPADSDDVIVTIRKVTVLKSPLGSASDWKVKFTVANQASTLYFDDVRDGSVLSTNRSFLVSSDALKCLRMEVCGSGMGDASLSNPKAALPARDWLKARTGQAAVRGRGFVCNLNYEIRPVDTRRPPLAWALPVYAIQSEGRLLWFRHAGHGDEGPRWLGPRLVGTGWEHCLHVFAGSAGTIYAVQPDGMLLWRRHLGSADGRADWNGPRQVSTGWQYFRKIVCDGAGVIYAIDEEGGLWWYRHLGYASGASEWEGPNRIGEGWDEFSDVIAGGNGVIYTTVRRAVYANLGHCGGVKYRQGDLLWHRHAGQHTGEATWFEPRRIGRGWNRYCQIFSDGADTLYAVAASDQAPYRHGDLLSCRHLGRASGAGQWADLERAGSGWSGFKTLICAR